MLAHGDDLPGEDLDVLKAELQQWRILCCDKASFDGKDISTPLEVFQLQCVSAGFYPDVHRVMQLIATLPVTTCECERCISSIRRLKTFLRSTIGQERFSALALMHVHYDHPVDLDHVVNLFAGIYPRVMALCDIFT